MPYNSNVFINCPFDPDYQVLLKPLLFTIRKAGLTPRIALERFDSGEFRLEKISELLLESKYSIHDLSRIKSTSAAQYFRLNMPFELGIDLGCKLYHPNKKYRSKKILILESEKNSVQKALSDVSFGDCKFHSSKAEEVVHQVRTWFVECGFKNVNPPSKIWDDYNIFNFNLYPRKKREGYSKRDIDRLPIPEFIQFMNEVI